VGNGALVGDPYKSLARTLRTRLLNLSHEADPRIGDSSAQDSQGPYSRAAEEVTTDKSDRTCAGPVKEKNSGVVPTPPEIDLFETKVFRF
jgi:hypothetical protein